MTAFPMVPARCREEDGGHHWVINVNVATTGVDVWCCSLCPEMKVDTDRHDKKVRAAERIAATLRIHRIVDDLNRQPSTLLNRLVAPSMVMILESAIEAVLDADG